MNDHERLSGKLHAMFCGCAASEPEGDCDLWCDSIWLVLATRIEPALTECIGNLRDVLARESVG
jgi:hypothetical protein